MNKIEHTVLVGSGKGGVGKSTVASLLGLGLAREGARVGLLDADIFGPSMPTLFGLQNQRPSLTGEFIEPLIVQNLKLMSLGLLIDPKQAVIWRGPMIHQIVTEFIQRVEWGNLDYLFIDLPPGTGDIPLSLTQMITTTGAIIVCTPQELARVDAIRSIQMLRDLHIPCIGLVENMSCYTCPKCGHEDHLFSRDGIKTMAVDLKLPFLGELPFNGLIRDYCDRGRLDLIFTETGNTFMKSLEAILKQSKTQIRGHRPLAVVQK